ncbi:MAG: alanyl-tRNA editing protein [Treponema sp.]|jgi:alanyl-tRNA synthetase|nr:alanyl-tRNA editing protein [Treponema sp.]
MKTIPLYYDYNSAEPFNANILEIRPLTAGTSALLLDAAIFYPEGGGQPADRGSINGVPLLTVIEQKIEKEREILHVVSSENAARLGPGPVELVLDVTRRMDHTVHHTGQHLLSGTILRMTGAYTLSMHMGDDLCAIDVDAKELSEETLVAVEEAVQTAIEQDHPVITHLCPPEDTGAFPLRKQIPQVDDVIRVVEIQGCDFSPCCGTHLPSTGRIGVLRILAAEKYKGMTRVHFIAGRRVLRDSRLLRRNADFISRALNVPVMETDKGVRSLLEKTGKLEQKLKFFQEEAAQRKAESLVSAFSIANVGADTEKDGKPRVITVSYMDADMEEVLRIGNAAQKLTSAVLVLASETAPGAGAQDDSAAALKFAAFCSAKGFDIRPLLKDALAAHHGRGGGGPSLFQGVFERPEDLHAFMIAIRQR